MGFVGFCVSCSPVTCDLLPIPWFSSVSSVVKGFCFSNCPIANYQLQISSPLALTLRSSLCSSVSSVVKGFCFSYCPFLLPLQRCSTGPPEPNHRRWRSCTPRCSFSCRHRSRTPDGSPTLTAG